MLQRQVGTGTAERPASTGGGAAPATSNVEVDELDYGFFFIDGPYMRAAESFLRRYHPTHRLIHAGSFEEMVDQLYTDIHAVRRGRRAHIREIIIVTHANAAGGMKIPLVRGDAARQPPRFFSPWDLADLQSEFLSGAHRRFAARRHEVVSEAIDDSTHVEVRGCELGQSRDAVDGLRSFLGGQAWVWAPTAFQGYETLEIGGSRLPTPEAAFDFLVQSDFLPADLAPMADEEKRAYIARVFGLRGTVPAEFFVVGQTAHDELARMIRAHEGTTAAAEDLTQREGVGIPSSGEQWTLSAPSLLGTDPELDGLSIAEIEARARALANPYRPENAWMLQRLRAAWERKPFDEHTWTNSGDPLEGLPPLEIFGDSNIVAMDVGRYPGGRVPQEDTFQTTPLAYSRPGAAGEAAAGVFIEPPSVEEGTGTEEPVAEAAAGQAVQETGAAVPAAGPSVAAPSGPAPSSPGGRGAGARPSDGGAGSSGVGSGGGVPTAEQRRAARDFEKTGRRPVPEPAAPEPDALANLEGEELIRAILEHLPPDLNAISPWSIADLIANILGSAPMGIEIAGGIAGAEVVIPAGIVLGAEIIALVEPVIAFIDLVHSLNTASEAQEVGAERLGLRLGLETGVLIAASGLTGDITAAQLDARLRNDPAVVAQISLSYPLGPDGCQEHLRIGYAAAAAALNRVIARARVIFRARLEQTGWPGDRIDAAYRAGIRELEYQAALRVLGYVFRRLRSQPR